MNEALAGAWPSPADALAPVADFGDPVERITFACEFLLRGVLAYQGGVPATISAASSARVGRPPPGHPVRADRSCPRSAERHAGHRRSRAARPAQAQSRRRGQRGGFLLADHLCGLSPDDAIAGLVRTATAVTEAATSARPRWPQALSGQRH